MNIWMYHHMKRLLFISTALLMLHLTTTSVQADWFLPQTGQTTCYDPVTWY